MYEQEKATEVERYDQIAYNQRLGYGKPECDPVRANVQNTLADIADQLENCHMIAGGMEHVLSPGSNVKEPQLKDRPLLGLEEQVSRIKDQAIGLASRLNDIRNRMGN